MKIQGPNLAKLTAYQQTQIQRQIDPERKVSREDQLDISNAAKQLQETKKTHTKRSEYVQDIKDAVKSGQYRVDHEQVAQKMIDYWSKHS